MTLADCLRPSEDGCLLTVRVTPKSSRDVIEGPVADDAGKVCLKVRVRAVPEGGKANKAVCQLIARYFGLPKSSVSLHAGDTSRIKQVRLACDMQTLLQKSTI